MSTAVLTGRLEPAQHTAAKVAGFLYMFMMVTANFAEFYARGRLIVFGDAVQTSKNIANASTGYRVTTATWGSKLCGHRLGKRPAGFWFLVALIGQWAFCLTDGPYGRRNIRRRHVHVAAPPGGH